jgi:transcriptional regulator with XRE-family HTH domain
MIIEDIFGQNISRQRRMRHWSQKELARRANVHRTYLSQVETGQRNPTLSLMKNIADALGVKLTDLLTG